jgi:hypothetical protein
MKIVSKGKEPIKDTLDSLHHEIIEKFRRIAE